MKQPGSGGMEELTVSPLNSAANPGSTSATIPRVDSTGNLELLQLARNYLGRRMKFMV
jgi:hypothetical protein